MDHKAGELLAQGLSVLRVGECEDNGVENAGNLGGARRDLGSERGEQLPVAKGPDDHNGCVWAPDCNPQEHIGDSHLGNFQLSALLSLKKKRDKTHFSI